jgi:DNA-binding transcriptional LysR family regulator
MDTLRAMRVIIAISEREGFSAAGRVLGLSPPAITRIVSELEAHLGVQLLARSTRSVHLTDAGIRFVEDARRVLLSVGEAEDAARGIHGELRGTVRVTASSLFGRNYVTRLLSDFLNRYPGMEVVALFVDRVVQLSEENQDIAVRIGHLTDSSLRATRVGAVRRIVCASPDYLLRRGVPASPGDLEQHETIGITALGAGLNWQFGQAGQTFERRVRPRIRVNSHEGGIAAAEAGFGLTQVCSNEIAAQLKAGSLVAVLGNFEPPVLPVHVLRREGERPPARVRAVMDHLVSGLRQILIELEPPVNLPRQVAAS